MVASVDMLKGNSCWPGFNVSVSFSYVDRTLLEIAETGRGLNV